MSKEVKKNYNVIFTILTHHKETYWCLEAPNVTGQFQCGSMFKTKKKCKKNIQAFIKQLGITGNYQIIDDTKELTNE